MKSVTEDLYLKFIRMNKLVASTEYPEDIDTIEEYKRDARIAAFAAYADDGTIKYYINKCGINK